MTQISRVSSNLTCKTLLEPKKLLPQKSNFILKTVPQIIENSTLTKSEKKIQTAELNDDPCKEIKKDYSGYFVGC